MLFPRRNVKCFGTLSAITILMIAISQTGFAQTESVLYTFTGPGPGPDAAFPSYGSLAIDSHGNLYGTTVQGGTFGYGTVFEIPAGGGEHLLYSFTGKADGLAPQAVILSDGTLYGTTKYGGTLTPACGGGCGTVFKLTGIGKETVIHAFAGPTSDGAYPFGGVIRDEAGNLYGTTSEGGLHNRFGTVFELTLSGSEHLYSFKHSPDGDSPWGQLFRDSSGNLYGTTYYGGKNGCGNVTGTCGGVFEISSAGESMIYSFGDSSTDGAYPEGGLIGDATGNLYGTASAGGEYGYGTVFKLSKATGTWEETILYNFTGLADGAYPAGSLIRDSHGNLYGTTPGGGSYGAGTVFRLTPAGQETVLYSFTGYADGFQPSAGVVADKQGHLYGTTAYGGDASCNGGCGVVFKLTP
jgi:uncharacterized repeat protein (TIGR03803 family)